MSTARTPPLLRQRRRILAAVALLLPGPLRVAWYRAVLRYDIGPGVRIGLSVVDAETCTIGAGASIGHLNVFTGIGELAIGDHAVVGTLNRVVGGGRVDLGAYTILQRQNELTSSRAEPGPYHQRSGRLTIGAATVMTTGHKVDFTADVEIGPRCVIGGRHSSLWTHNRWRSRPIAIGRQVYLGSEVRLAPGAVIPDRSIVALGSVVVGKLDPSEHLFGGNPAAALRPLREDDLPHVDARTRADMPDGL